MIAAQPQLTTVCDMHQHHWAAFSNAGGPCVSLDPARNHTSPGIRMMDDPYAPYYTSMLRSGRLLLEVPYTRLHFATGPGKEQNLEVLHAQQLTQRWYADVNFRVNSSPGQYESQRTDLGTVAASLGFTAPNGQYEALARFGHYKYRITENGGIADDSLFLSGSESDPGVIPVRLSGASSIRRNTLWNLRHALRLFAHDSPRMPWLPRQLIHQVSTQAEYRVFSDPNPTEAFYPAPLQNATATYDSIGMTLLSNTVSLTSVAPDHAGSWSYALGSRLENGRYFDGGSRQQLVLAQPFILVNLPLTRQAQASLQYTHILPGQFEGQSMNLLLNNVASTDSLLRWMFGLNYQRGDAALIYRHYRGNHYAWANAFEAVQQFRGEARLEWKGMRLDAHAARNRQAVLQGADARPFQHEQALHYALIQAGYESRVGVLRQYTRLRYLWREEPSLQPWPEWIATTSVQAQVNPFRAAFSLRLGADLSWVSAWQGYRYEPVTGSLLLQQEGRQGSHLFADAYLALFMERASICLKYRNLGNAILGEGYYLVQGYPMPVPGLLFSVQWSFFD